MGASPDGLIVDVGTKTEALILQGEMLSLGVDGQAKLKAGDTVKVMVLQPSSQEGRSPLDRARGEEGWDVLAERHESGEVFDAQVTGHNRGGILVNVEGVNAFVPLSQVDSVRRDDTNAVDALAGLVGKSVRLKVIEPTGSGTASSCRSARRWRTSARSRRTASWTTSRRGKSARALSRRSPTRRVRGPWRR